MLESVFINGGFYIGRYEVGTDTARTSSSADLTTPLIQRDKYPYNRITCSQAQTLAKQLSIGGKTSSLMFGIQWDLVLKYIETKGGKTQNQLKTDSKTWGNYKEATFSITRGEYLSGSTWNTVTSYTKPASNSRGVLLTTGATDRNSVLGIYDLAGNVDEWTLEYSSQFSGSIRYPCTIRGGIRNDFNLSYPVSFRYDCKTTDYGFSDYNIGCRSTLW